MTDKPKLLDQLREALRSRHYSRRTMLPESLKVPLADHLGRVKAIHDKDINDGWGRVVMPDALDRKYPKAPVEWRWQWVFLRKPDNTHQKHRCSYNYLKLNAIMKFLVCVLSGSKAEKRFYQETI